MRSTTALGRYVCGKSGLGGYHTPHAIQLVSHHLTFPPHPHPWTTSMETTPGSIFFFFLSFFFTYTSLRRTLFFDHDHGDRSPGVHTLAYEPTATSQGFQAQSCERGAF
ncbi:hypothetical protein ACN38_g6311 [Penicillium nordicum]|uniref:Uncharacterized protein n=1 Tax=Penicillium nordicum TaxID=229535 RepID=A0A0M9WFG4_9EURO|nr:hypothetical protein ACN38_g6311 [Penicillium nordicum]